MGIFSIISLLFTILFRLPKLIGTVMAIIKLVRSMKDKDLLGDLAVLGEILTLILGIIPLNKDLAKDSLDALKLVLESKDLEALKGLKNDLETKKKKCEGNFCPSDTK